jgi:inward rectifier potassium channel
MKLSKNKNFDKVEQVINQESNQNRFLNKDGSFNVKKTNIPLIERFHFFHWLIYMSWFRFLCIIFLGYFLVNILFASIYFAIGTEHLTGIEGASDFRRFISAYFFSAQTMTTLGYGRMAPLGIIANSVAAIESMLGLLSFAIITGMLFARFSRAVAKLKYSKYALISKFQNTNALMFRVTNSKDNQLFEVKVKVSISMKRENSDLRDFFQVKLERSKVPVFPFLWTIVHPINDSSPLWKLSENDFQKKDTEFIILIKGFDESTSQTVYSRFSYKYSEVKWGKKFSYIPERSKHGISLDLKRIDETVDIELN